jgi:predicted RNA-binding protein associated with RNAse of E/G family
MNDDLKKVTIHLARIGKPERSYQEGFVVDDGIRLKTYSVVPKSVSLHLSEEFCKQGWLLEDQLINSVSKYHFYKEFFSIVEYQDTANKVLGYYCDIVTPIQKRGDEYFLIDLILDLWIFPDYRVVELDRDEFETAISSGLFPLSFEKDTLSTFSRLKSEIKKGIFPRYYLA